MPKTGKKWKIEKDKITEIKDIILNYGGVEDSTIKSKSEAWRIRVNKAVFTMYNNGTLYNNMIADNKDMLKLYDKISECSTPAFEDTKREFRIGIDEVGKGEVAGEMILCGARFPSIICEDIESEIKMADTKSKKPYTYWKDMRSKINKMTPMGLYFDIEKIPPKNIDKHNINRLMDLAYQRIISGLIKVVQPNQTSIVIDDYNIGSNFKNYLNELEEMGAAIVIRHKADDNFLESKLASIIAKSVREETMKQINDDYVIDGIHIGSGGPADPETQKWLQAWKRSGQAWPEFIRTSYTTIRKLDGISGTAKKTSELNSKSLGQWM